jgi:hypothetical protein
MSSSLVKDLRTVAALAAAALCACSGDQARSLAPPTDRFHYPTGIALRHVAAGCAAPPCACAPGAGGCDTLLHVVSSNMDLAFDVAEGGTVAVLRVPDVAERPAALAPGEVQGIADLAPLQRGWARVGSFGGELAILDEETCPGWESGGRQAAAFVASRNQGRLYRVALAVSGAPTCGDGCRIPLDPVLGDPYSTPVACRQTAAGLRATVFVTFFLTPQNLGYLQEVLLSGELPAGATEFPVVNPPFSVGIDAAHSARFDPVRQRLWFTGRFAGPGTLPFRFVDVAFTGTLPPGIDLASQIFGAEGRGFALSSDGRRAYLGLRLYDPFTSALYGVRTPDTGGALAVVGIEDGADGRPSGRLLRFVPLGLGPSEVRAISRPGRRDLVAVSCADDGTLHLYDDDAGAVARVFALDPATGKPVLGRQPFGLAAEQRTDGKVRLFVGSFRARLRLAIRMDDPAAPRDAWVEMRSAGSGREGGPHRRPGGAGAGGGLLQRGPHARRQVQPARGAGHLPGPDPRPARGGARLPGRGFGARRRGALRRPRERPRGGGAGRDLPALRFHRPAPHAPGGGLAGRRQRRRAQPGPARGRRGGHARPRGELAAASAAAPDRRHLGRPQPGGPRAHRGSPRRRPFARRRQPPLAGGDAHPRPALPGGPSPPGMARLLAGLSGGRLAVAEFERDPDPAATPGSLKRRGPLVVRDLGFDAVHLAVSPDGGRVFAATPDPLLDAGGQPVRGVAQIDASGADPLAWPVVGLDARAPTRLVAAGILSERTADDADLFGRWVADPGVPSGRRLEPDPRLEVLAVLDESACGPGEDIDCGIATLVPDDASRGGGIAADPAGQLPYRAPIRLGGDAMPLDLTVAPPRAAGDPPVNARQVVKVMSIAPPTGRRDATAVGAVAAGDGRVHLVDVGRWAEGNAISPMRGAARAGVASLDVLAASDTKKLAIGLWNERLIESGQPATVIEFTDMPALQKLATTTPGFATDEAWSVVWEGLIPGLVLRPGTVGLANGTPFVALQRPAAGTWITAGNIANPALGVRVGDIAFVAIPDAVLCPPQAGFAVGGFEARVTGFLAPDPTWYPAGALAVDRLSDPDHTACIRDVVDAAAPTRDAELSIRGQGLVLSGQRFGYAGRPILSVDPGAAATRPMSSSGRTRARSPLRRQPATAPPASSSPSCARRGGASTPPTASARRRLRRGRGSRTCPAPTTPPATTRSPASSPSAASPLNLSASTS